MASSIMFPASCANAMSLETVIGTKRTTHSLDGLNLKKRRKQSKPVRIASTEDSLSGEDTPSGTNSNLSPNNLIVSGNFSINSDVKMTPLNLSKQSEMNEQVVERISKTPGSDPDSDSLYRKQNISPFNHSISHQTLALNLTSHMSIDGSQVKIFNPDAFCDLCNKEFCNKYFLKTHRANKHRVYSESTGNVPFETFSPKQLASTTDLTPQNNLFLSKSWSTKKSSLQNNGTQNKLQFTRNQSNGISSTMRAFCNICRKEFCNKYFVRRHKAKIHGIADKTSEVSNAEGKNGPECVSHQNESNQDSTNDSEIFLEKDDISLKNQWHIQNGLTNITCGFCDEELIDSSAFLKHLDEVHNNPDGEINIEENVLNLQVNQNSLKEKSSTEKSSIEVIPHVKRDDFNQHYNSANTEIQYTSENQQTPSSTFGNNLPQKTTKITNVIQRDLNEPHINTNEDDLRYPSPLNLALNHNDFFMGNGNKVLENCMICGEQFESLYIFQVHMMKVHNINLTSKEPAALDITVKDSSCSPRPMNKSPTPSEKEKFADDTKKLHKMILKMNYTETTVCDLCDTDFKSIYFLEYHILKTHRSLLEEVNSIIEEDCNASNQSKNVKDCQDGNKDDSSMQQDSLQMSSFCDICKKELCNKYFMKTHMQRMHGISIETGTHIGGVMCDICNKELCSKYFLRVHKQNSHGLVDDSLLPRLWVVDLLKNSTGKDKNAKTEDNTETSEKHKTLSEVCPKCNKRFRLSKWLKIHLCIEHGEGTPEIMSVPLSESPNPHESMFQSTERKNDEKTERNILNSPPIHSESSVPNCEISTNYQPNLSLSKKAEVSEKQGEPFQVLSSMLSGNNSIVETKLYHCSQCSFSTPALAYLYVHERSHTEEKSLTFFCPICTLGFDSRESLLVHLSLHENIQSIDIPSKLGETCWTAASDSKFYQNKGHDPDFTAMLSKVRETLLHAAGKLNNSLSFAVPYSQESFLMQPFFLESAKEESLPADKVLSSLVFLPVKEKLSEPVTVSFKLTPT